MIPISMKIPIGASLRGMITVSFVAGQPQAQYSLPLSTISGQGKMMETGFGWIEIGGVRYDHDIVIHTDDTVTKRKKKLSKGLKGVYGHTPIDDAEVAFLVDEMPEVVYIGTGQYGDLPITPGAQKVLERFSPVIMPTPEILPRIENDRRRYAAVLHVTC
jgi:hypothetical protein